MVDASNNNSRITFATKEYVQSLDPNYKTVTGTPTLAYLASGSTLGFFPVPSANATVNYEYGASPPTRLSTTTATFSLPDRWVKYIEKAAEAMYKSNKGFGDSDEKMAMALDMRSDILIEAWEANPTYLTNEGLV